MFQATSVMHTSAMYIEGEFSGVSGISVHDGGKQLLAKRGQKVDHIGESILVTTLV